MRKLLSVLVMISMLAVLLPLQASASLTMHQSLSTADAEIFSVTPTGGLGYAVAIVGDVNNDGYDDYIATDNWNNSYKGNAYLFWGTNKTLPNNANAANVTFYPEATGSPIWTVVALGDVNRDGFDDFAIGAPDSDNPVWDAGAAYIFFGKAAGWGKYLNVSSANAIIRGTAMMDLVGERMAGPGDVNGDKYDDIVIGCFGAGGWGVTYLFLGKHNGPSWNTSMNLTHATASFHGDKAKTWTGYAVSGGDVNGDGLDDIIISAPGQDIAWDYLTTPGYVYVVFGRTAGWAKNVNLTTGANASYYGEHYDEHIGQSISVPGDVNGDGYEDILIGAPYNDEIGAQAGEAYLVLGRESGWALNTNLSGADASWRGEATNNQAGYIVSTAGDVNGDNYADFMIAAPLNSDQTLTTQGQTYLFLGKPSGWATNQNINTATASWLGEANNDAAPTSLAGKGDINGDNSDDLMFGLQRFAAPGGSVYLVFPFMNKRAANITTVKCFMDSAFTKPATYAAIGDRIFVKMTGVDGDPANVNIDRVKITSFPRDMTGIMLDLRETGANTGVYIGNFTVENFTQEDLRFIDARPVSFIRVRSETNTTAYYDFSVGGTFKISSLTVLPGGNPTLYAMKTSYSIRVNVSDSLGGDHLDHVNLSLALNEGPINFTYTKATDTFTKVSDPGFFTKLDGASFADTFWGNTSVTFRVFFNWTFPDENYHMVSASMCTKEHECVSKEQADAFKVEKHLDLTGTLQMKEPSGRLIKDGSAVVPGLNITFTGVTVIYKGYPNTYPPNTEFDLVITDDEGSTWVDSDSAGTYLYQVVQAPAYTDELMNYTVAITGPPADCINRSIKTTLKIDGDQIAFADPLPSSSEWQANKRVMAKVNITDTGGSLVKSETIEFRAKPNGGVWGAWTNAQLTGAFPNVQASALVSLADGPLNAVQWRGSDGVGNLAYDGSKTTSPEYIIKVDTVAPTFSSAWPLTGESKSANVSFGIRATDPWSLVKGDSLEFTISTDDQESWSDWKNAGYNGTLALIDCKANATFLHGSKNFVRWRVTDTLGNTNMSDPLQIFVNLTPPKPPNRRPDIPAIADKSVNVGQTLIVNAVATDPDEDVLTFSLTQNPEGMVITPQGLITFSPTKDQEGVHNVTVKVSDSKLDNSTSFKVTVVLLRPTISVTNPGSLQGELKGKVSVSGTAGGGVSGIAKVEYCVDNGTWTAATGTTGWSFVWDTKDVKDGTHTISIRATDGLGSQTAQDLTVTVKNKKKTGGDNGDISMLMIGVIVAIIAACGTVVAVLMMRKKKGKPVEQMPPQDQSGQYPANQPTIDGEHQAQQAQSGSVQQSPKN